MIANINNASYIENITEQLSTDTDWTSIDATTSTVLPESIYMYSSTLSTVDINNKINIGDSLTTVSSSNTVTDVVADNVTYYDDGYVNKADKQNVHAITSSGDLGAWSLDANSMPSGNLSYRVFSTSTRVYAMSVYAGATTVPELYYSVINSDGTLGAWNIEVNVPSTAVDRTNIVVTSSRVYLLGGLTIGTPTNVIQTALINSDGSITGWVTETNTLPVALVDNSIIVTPNRVYSLGGFNGTTAIDTIYSCPINTDGTLGTWITETNVLPNPVSDSGSYLTSTTAYLVGGFISSNKTNQIVKATLNSDGTLGTWSIDTITLPYLTGGSSIILTKDYVTVLGTVTLDNTSTVTPITYTAPIDATGVTGTFIVGTNTLSSYDHTDVVVTSTKAYILGGIYNNTVNNNMYVVNFNGWKIYNNSYHNDRYTVDITSSSLTAIPTKCYFQDDVECYISAGSKDTVVIYDTIGIDPLSTSTSTSLDTNSVILTGETITIDGVTAKLGNVTNTVDANSVVTYTGDLTNFNLTTTPKVVHKLPSKVVNTLDMTTLSTALELTQQSIVVGDDILINDTNLVPVSSVGYYDNTDVIDVVNTTSTKLASTVNLDNTTILMVNNGAYEELLLTTATVVGSSYQYAITGTNSITSVYAPSTATTTTHIAMVSYGLQQYTPLKLALLDNTIKLNLLSKTFDGTNFTHTYESLTKQCRVVQRKLVALRAGTTILEPFVSSLFKL